VCIPDVLGLGFRHRPTGRAAPGAYSIPTRVVIALNTLQCDRPRGPVSTMSRATARSAGGGRTPRSSDAWERTLRGRVPQPIPGDYRCRSTTITAAGSSACISRSADGEVFRLTWAGYFVQRAPTPPSGASASAAGPRRSRAGGKKTWQADTFRLGQPGRLPYRVDVFESASCTPQA